ncbi:acyl-CoA synthetase [Alteromonas sp. C1M14]|uniref:acyl-CoA synthetase n=1 Tax=Alteromonas sp. C1M14 TaxID=2841567 RepID=UPI001C091C3C|nr:acyl-CoA synthetase [Alteromonas sp. C1M14]MBU2979975.1 acyl-CoA synthetase [Alteromonas sp. C1M14]
MSSIYSNGLEKNEANFSPVTPVDFLARANDVYPNAISIIHGALRQTWAQTYQRCCRYASALKKAGIKKGDTVAVMLPNTPAMVESHFAIPMVGAVINAINIRLDEHTIAFILEHGEAKLLLVDKEFSQVVKRALLRLPNPPKVINVDDVLYDGPGEAIGDVFYEAFIASGDEGFVAEPPTDEWDAIALNYTSGTTGNPKGVVYSHRGAYLAAVSNILEWDMPKHPCYLWTLPMFHCNGWTFPWVIAARAGINVCLRKVDPALIFDLIRQHKVSHYCGAPIVHSMLINADDSLKQGIEHKVSAFVAGAAPSAAMIEGMDSLGFDIIHVYGLTEVYGPAIVCDKQHHWQALSLAEQAQLNSRQGVRYHLQQGVDVFDTVTGQPVPKDGETIGEVVVRGNITMKGYLKNPSATADAFANGWFKTGDLAVIYPDNYIKLKDRSKDIIISGGENISSIEVEDCLYQHPAVMLAAVVAMPDEKWGETVCAFIELKAGTSATEAEMITHCKANLAHFKVPRVVKFEEVPKTSTGKIQKFALRKQLNSKASIAN